MFKINSRNGTFHFHDYRSTYCQLYGAVKSTAHEKPDRVVARNTLVTQRLSSHCEWLRTCNAHGPLIWRHRRRSDYKQRNPKQLCIVCCLGNIPLRFSHHKPVRHVPRITQSRWIPYPYAKSTVQRNLEPRIRQFRWPNQDES